MSSYSSIYYFLMANHKTHQEIGNYINNNLKDKNFDNIKYTCDDIFRSSPEEISKNKKNKVALDFYIIYYTLKTSGTFYLCVVPKKSLYNTEQDLIFELFEDIEHQGIKKLVNKNGELTRVGNQNLKFCIELFQENNRKNKSNEANQDKDNEYFYMKNKDKDKDKDKISLLNNEINDIHNNVKESVKNMITNVNDMNDLDNKSLKIKDSSEQFQKDSAVLERKIRFRKLIRKILIYCIFALIIILIIYFIFF